jgi:hypothetical protein
MDEEFMKMTYHTSLVYTTEVLMLQEMRMKEAELELD